MPKPTGPFTSDMVQAFAAACGVGTKPWVRLYAWAACHFTFADRLEGIEAAWLEEWMSGEGLTDPSSLVVVQVSVKQAARELFNGQQTTASRAVGTLLEKGLLSLIAKGVKGHASLYLAGNRGDTNEGCFVYPTSEAKVHISDEKVHISDEKVHISEAANCGNVGLINKSSLSQERDGEMENGKEKKKCPRCGGELEPGGEYMPNLLYCRSCDVALPAKKKVA